MRIEISAMDSDEVRAGLLTALDGSETKSSERVPHLIHTI